MTTEEFKLKPIQEQVEFIVNILGPGSLFDEKVTIDILRDSKSIVKLVKDTNLKFPNTPDSDLVDKVLAQLQD